MREPLRLNPSPLHAAPQLSVVIPCYNEAEALPLLIPRLQTALEEIGAEWEIIFVDDGSQDGTYEFLELMHEQEARLKVLALSRNFGHQPALSAGLAWASGEAVAMLDADLQDPPELLPRLFRKLQEGYDVVYGIRRSRKESLPKRAAYALFYRLFRKVSDSKAPLDSGDFCLVTRPVAEVLNAMHERNVFLRGLRAWAGFRQVGIPYERGARAAGKTKYSLWKLCSLAADGVFSFSILPLRLAAYLGLLGLAVSVVLGLAALALVFRGPGLAVARIPPWTWLAGSLLLFGSIQLLILGCLGEYIGRIYSEVKRRPRWIVRDCLGFSLAPAANAGLLSKTDPGQKAVPLQISKRYTNAYPLRPAGKQQLVRPQL
jgi:dolichol-phosphate mannosyltransferase